MHSNVSIHIYPDSVIQSQTIAKGAPFEILTIKDSSRLHGIDLLFSGDEVAAIDRLIVALVDARSRVLDRPAVPA
jgi:hypothetical protein